MSAHSPSSLERCSNLPISSPYRSTPDAPVTDAERDRLNARLMPHIRRERWNRRTIRHDWTFSSPPNGSVSWCLSLTVCHPYQPTRVRRSSQARMGSPANCRSHDHRDVNRRRRGRSGCCHPPHCHLAGALDLAVRHAWPARPPNRSAVRSEYCRAEWPTTIRYGYPNLVSTRVMDL